MGARNVPWATTLESGKVTLKTLCWRISRVVSNPKEDLA
jgi:hypothetical protein